jgi:hypothetical protein
MSETNREPSTRTRAITRDRYDAVLLDLDRVITDTLQHTCGVLETDV